MVDKDGRVFNQPVDPVVLMNIPDYFGNDKKSKMQGNKYRCTREFVEDVRLIFFFPMQMRYYPPSHDVRS